MTAFDKTLSNILILTTTYYCSILIFLKVRGFHYSFSKVVLLFIGEAFVLLIAFLGGNYSFLLKLFFMILTVVSMLLLEKKKVAYNLPISLFIVGIAYAIEYMSVFLAGLVLFFLIGYRSADVVSTLVSCAIQLLLTFLVTKTKWLKKGLLYFERKENYGLGLLLSAYIIVFSLVITEYSDHSGSNIEFILLLGVPLILTGLILWIRSIVQRYRKNKLKDRADAYTQQEMVEKDEKINRLEAEVATLAKQLHRDNHLLSSVDRSVQKLGESQSREQREQIIREIHTLYQERNDLMTEEQEANHNLPSTGIALIDSSLNEMYIKAAAHHILLDIIVKEQLHYIVNHVISQTDLQTLLCDHLKDAIIAIDTAKIDNGKILMTIEKNEGIFEISIHDNGVDFDSDTLSKLGKERVTTHSDEGGSGIGFMTTFETLAKTKSSLTITEHKNKAPFSKSITFTFNRLNRFIISSYRKEELKSAIARDDIIFV